MTFPFLSQMPHVLSTLVYVVGRRLLTCQSMVGTSLEHGGYGSILITMTWAVITLTFILMVRASDKEAMFLYCHHFKLQELFVFASTEFLKQWFSFAFLRGLPRCKNL